MVWSSTDDFCRCRRRNTSPTWHRRFSLQCSGNVSIMRRMRCRSRGRLSVILVILFGGMLIFEALSQIEKPCLALSYSLLELTRPPFVLL